MKSLFPTSGLPRIPRVGKCFGFTTPIETGESRNTVPASYPPASARRVDELETES